jgi:enoyl-CoA hydratase
MISEVTEPGGALDAAVALAERVAKNAPLAVAASKKLVRAASEGFDEPELWQMQQPFQAKVFTSNDAKEGPRAFAEKREPNWTGT